MRKSKALEMLGGTTTAAAEAIGISYQAVEKWPDPLPPRISDRVQAAIARRLLPPQVLGIPKRQVRKAGADEKVAA